MYMQECHDRLVGLGDFKDVFIGGAKTKAKSKRLLRTPAAVVFPLPDDASDKEDHCQHFQRVKQLIGVLVVVDYETDRDGSKQILLLENILTRVRRRLKNFQPAAEADPIVYLGSAFLRIEEGQMRWLLTFKTTYDLEAE